MTNSEVATRNVITVYDDDMDYSTEDIVEVLNGGEFLNGLVRLYGAKHMHMMVEDNDDDFEDKEIFEESDDIEIVEELINLVNPSLCQFFSMEEWQRYSQLASVK